VTGAGNARLGVLAAALLFSTGGAAIKATQLNGWQTAGLRSMMAACALLILVPEARRGWSWRIVPTAAAYAVTLVSFVMANKLTTSANAIFLQATAPAYLLLLGPLFLKERLRRRDWWFTLALVCGMALFFLGAENPLATAPDPARGNLFGAVSGAAYALTLTGLRWQAHLNPAGNAGLATVAAGNFLVFAAMLPMALPVARFTAADGAAILYLGVFQIGLAYTFLTRSFRRLPAFEASTLLLAEPVFNPLWTWWLQGETPSGRALAGGAIILGSTLYKVWHERQSEE
jgi:drug/metabolite transporter (DMT)-like permease